MTIVLSYHGNRESGRALEEALVLARRLQTSVTVVLAQKAGNDDYRTKGDAEARLWAHLDQTDVPFEIRYTQRPNQTIADSVLDAARHTNADYIVLGLRPGGSGSTTLGPNASRILLDAPCPVVTTTTHD